MINAILNFSVRQRMLVILGTLVLIGFGVLALKQIPIDAFPNQCTGTGARHSGWNVTTGSRKTRYAPH
jgi:Cu/Ag efflux pump CusA